MTKHRFFLWKLTSVSLCFVWMTFVIFPIVKASAASPQKKVSTRPLHYHVSSARKTATSRRPGASKAVWTAPFSYGKSMGTIACSKVLGVRRNDFGSVAKSSALIVALWGIRGEDRLSKCAANGVHSPRGCDMSDSGKEAWLGYSAEA